MNKITITTVQSKTPSFRVLTEKPKFWLETEAIHLFEKKIMKNKSINNSLSKTLE